MSLVCWTVVCGLSLVAGQVPAGDSSRSAAGVRPAQTSSSGTSSRSTATKRPLTNKERQFRQLDRDGNGVLTEREFLGGSVGKVAEQKKALFRQLDGDRSGGLDLAEFESYRPPPPPREVLRKEFERKDSDGDGKITWEEFVGSRQGDARWQARKNFIRLDRDGDGVVTQKEYLQRGQPVRLTSEQQFRIRDRDEDGRLTLEEFLEPLKGTKWYESAKRNFVRFDLNRDGFLQPEEFAVTPARHPDARAWFRARDRDHDGKLTPRELVLLMRPEEVEAALASFSRYDRDGDGALDLKEYLRRERSLQWSEKQERVASWVDRWSVPVILGLDVLVLVYVGWSVRRWWSGRRPSTLFGLSGAGTGPQTGGPARPGQSSQRPGPSAAGSSEPQRSRRSAAGPPEQEASEAPLPESIDEFRVE